MPRILNPKDITGATRFNFDFNLTLSMVAQLAKEFKKECPSINVSSNSVKLINKEKKKVVEIGPDFISFFPRLSDEKIEEIRKKIYKHVAKRSEVYFRTSKENLELSIASLLSDDLRSCASLLYYSIHKFINGEMYSYLNTKLDLEDHEIELKEVEHFTSANFNLFVREKKDKHVDLTRENYKDILCTRRELSVDPFVLFQYIISDEVLKDCSCFTPYIEYISNDMFGKSYADSDLPTHLKELFEEFLRKKEEKIKTSQEEEVKASIAYSLLKTFETEDKAIWFFYVLILRLYWLRQTADYDFDFEVKTSVREMSILLLSVKKFLDIQLRRNTEDESHEDNRIEEGSFSAGNKHELKVDEQETKIIQFYNVDTSFPSEINFNEDVFAFMTAVHLDPFFNKDNVFSALNLTENITNKGKYFIYESRGLVEFPLYLHINDDGRWTAWIPGNLDKWHIITHNDLLNLFEEFIDTFVNSYNECFGTKYIPWLVVSKPIFTVPSPQTVGKLSLNLIRDAFETRKNILQSRFMSELVFKLKTTFFGFDAIKINDLIIHFRIIFGFNTPFDLIPIKEIFTSKFSKNPYKRAVINILIDNDGVKDDDLLVVDKIFATLKENFDFSNFLNENFITPISPTEFENFLLGEDDSYFLGLISKHLNSIAYDQIVEGNFNTAKLIIDRCLNIPTSGAFPLATMGLWYLRNEEIDLDEAETKGMDYYQKSIELDTPDKDEYINHLQQKFYYEMARFYIIRKKDYSKGSEFLQKALEMGEDCYFYDDAQELKKQLEELTDKNELKAIAATKEIDGKISEELSS